MVKLKKRFGQHLLISQGVLSEIAKRAEIKEGETLLEIGPGLGHLTKELLKYPLKTLYLLEIDKEMISVLKENLKDNRIIILFGDATKFNYNLLSVERLKVVGNLPYNAASLILENLVDSYHLIYFALFLVQKEVAEKLVSGGSWLSVYITTFYDIHYLMTLPPKFFKPQPKVDSALINLKINVKSQILDLLKYKKFLTFLFQNRRKMLRKKFSPSLLELSGITSTKRVDELSFKEILILYHNWLNFLQKETPLSNLYSVIH